MTDKELLSQEEIDALLHGVLNGEVETSPAVTAEGGVSDYDFGGQNTIVRGSMPALELINDRFAGGFSDSLFELLRRNASVSVSGVQILNFADYMHSLFIPASLNVVRIRPLQGTALLVFDPRLVFMFIDHYFGGNGRYPGKIEAREFSHTENSVISLLLEKASSNLVAAWAPLLDIEIEALPTETNPQSTNIVGAKEAVVVTSFEVALDGSSGEIHVVLPCSMIEPIRDQLDAGLSSDGAVINKQWRHALRDELSSAQLELVCEFTKTQLNLSEIMSLKKGDVIPVEAPQAVTLSCHDIPVYKGQIGISQGHCAVRVTSAAGHAGATD